MTSKHQSQVPRDGDIAHRHGHGLDQNPFPPGHPSHDEWANDWRFRHTHALPTAPDALGGRRYPEPRPQNHAIVIPPATGEDRDMGTTVEKPATYEDLLAAPKHMIAEIIHGRLVTMPRPARKHAYSASKLDRILGTPFDRGIGGPGGWYMLFEPELHFGIAPNEEITVPDLAGWRLERKPGPDETVYFTTVPDWTCEFLSPSSQKDDRFKKPGIYASYGVEYYWLGDPEARTLETFRLVKGIWERTGKFSEGDLVAAPPFHEVPFNLGELWEK
jgi:Uma2 family endonuclease